jgi:hypothetical protein
MNRAQGHQFVVDLIRRLSNQYQAHNLLDLAKQASSAQAAYTTDQPTQADRPSPHFHINRRLSQAIIMELVDAYRRGTPTTTLCEQYHLAKGSVLKLLADHNVTMRHQPLTEQQIEQAIERYQAGDSLATIGTALGSTASTVRAALKARGIVMGPAGGSKPGHKRKK